MRNFLSPVEPSSGESYKEAPSFDGEIETCRATMTGLSYKKAATLLTAIDRGWEPPLESSNTAHDRFKSALQNHEPKEISWGWWWQLWGHSVFQVNSLAVGMNIGMQRNEILDEIAKKGITIETKTPPVAEPFVTGRTIIWREFQREHFIQWKNSNLKSNYDSADLQERKTTHDHWQRPLEYSNTAHDRFKSALQNHGPYRHMQELRLIQTYCVTLQPKRHWDYVVGGWHSPMPTN